MCGITFNPNPFLPLCVLKDYGGGGGICEHGRHRYACKDCRSSLPGTRVLGLRVLSLGAR